MAWPHFMAYAHLHGGVQTLLENTLIMSVVHKGDETVMWNCSRKVDFQKWKRNGTCSGSQHHGLTSDSSWPQEEPKHVSDLEPLHCGHPDRAAWGLLPALMTTLAGLSCVFSVFFPPLGRPAIQQCKCQLTIIQPLCCLKSTPYGTSENHAVKHFLLTSNKQTLRSVHSAWNSYCV
jgi:hypothetical protein